MVKPIYVNKSHALIKYPAKPTKVFGYQPKLSEKYSFALINNSVLVISLSIAENPFTAIIMNETRLRKSRTEILTKIQQIIYRHDGVENRFQEKIIKLLI